MLVLVGGRCVAMSANEIISSDGGRANQAQSLVEQWLEQLTRQGYSLYTLDNYRRAVLDLANFLQKIQATDVNGIDLNSIDIKNIDGADIVQADNELLSDDCILWHTCQQAQIRAYFAKRFEQDGISVVSAKLYLTAIKAFFEFANRQGVGASNPTKGYRLRGKSDRLPKLLDTDLVAQLLDQPSPSDPKQQPLWVRDLAMFELIYSSGLRVGELVRLALDDVDFGTRFVSVLGKGGKHRQVPIGKKAYDALLAYLPIREDFQPSTQALFVGKTGRALSVRAVQLRLSIAASRAGIAQHLHPHLLRHAFASHFLSASGNLKAVQEMLGHSSLSATQRYTHLDFAALAAVYDNAHPRK